MPDDYHQDAVVALGLAGAGAMGTMLAPSVETQCVSLILTWYLAFGWDDGHVSFGTLEEDLVVWLFEIFGKLENILCCDIPTGWSVTNVSKKIQKTKVLPSWNLPWWFHHHQVYHQLLHHCQLPLRLHSNLAFWRLGWSWKPLGQETWTWS